MQNQEIIDKYDEVKLSLEKAIDASDNISLSGEEENAELERIRTKLNRINDDFKDEIDRLEGSSEWDRFCIAFFGETNAGKSTIIESLRIVYDEETRREDIYNQGKKLDEEVIAERERYRDLLNKLKHLNNALDVQKVNRKKNYLYGMGLTIIGVVVGYLIAFIML